MQITIPEIRQEIKLSEYAPEFGEQMLSVRVNPPRRVIEELANLRKKREENKAEEARKDFIRLFSEIWECDQEDVIKLNDYSQDTDPQFFPWLIGKTMQLITEHRAEIKKN